MNPKPVDWTSILKPESPASLEAWALDGPLAVYGGGSVGRDTIRFLRARGANVSHALDFKSYDRELEGLPLRRPDDPVISRSERARTKVVLGLFNAYVNFDEVRAKLSSEGWELGPDFLHIHALDPTGFGDRFWLGDRGATAGHLDAIARADEKWADEASRELFRKLLRYRMTGDASLLPFPALDGQYFPKDVPSWKEPLRLIDGGAFDGDTLRQAQGMGLKINAAALFEPDPRNFDLLSRELDRAAGSISLILAYPCGLAENAGIFRFDAGKGTGSGMDPTGESVIQCVSVDQALRGFQPNLIKLDIEGAEHAALLGAQRVIRECRPGLAVCLYHRPADLWQIPNLVADWGLDYQLYLRLHLYNGFELVLYAVPS